MTIPIAYGKQGLEIEIPEANLPKVLTMGGAPPLEDPHAALLRALREPIAGPALEELARGAQVRLHCDL